MGSERGPGRLASVRREVFGPAQSGARELPSGASDCAAPRSKNLRPRIESRPSRLRRCRGPQPPLDAPAVKHNQRLDNQRLAEILAERGLVDPQALREAVQFASHGRVPLTEALVSSNLVQDWELSRIVCELYNLPFITVDMLEPDPKARQDLDIAFLIENCLVPIGRFGQVLTVAMPAMVPADVLAYLSAETDLCIIPFVGSVRTNRKWIERNLNVAAPPAALPSPVEEQPPDGAPPQDWGSLFDAADAAVLLDLQPPSDDGEAA